MTKWLWAKPSINPKRPVPFPHNNTYMPANVSVQNGIAEMFSGNNVVPWHNMGTIVSGLLTAKQAIEAAHLGWKVKCEPVFVGGVQLPFPDDKNSTDCYQGIVRDDNNLCLAIMKGKYEPIQNTDCFDFMDVLAGEGNLKYETAGALRNGKQVWMMAKYNGDIEINKDKHETWLLLCTSHDGSYSLMVQWITVRVVCANTLSLALKTARNQVKIRHTKTWADKVSEARRVLGLTVNYFEEMRKTLAGMNEQIITPDAASAFTRLLFPAKDEKDVPTLTSNMRWGVQRLFNRPEAGTFGQTRWDMLNAVTDWADHEQKLRGKNSTRLESSLLGTGAALKQTAFEILTSEKIMAELLSKPLNMDAASASEFQALLNK